LVQVAVHENDREPLLSSFIRSSMRRVATGSNAEQGSSIGSTSGSAAIERAMRRRPELLSPSRRRKARAVADELYASCDGTA